MQKYYHDLLVEAEQQGPKIAQQPLFKDKWSTSKCLKFTKRLTYDLIVQDKEPLALLERNGFRGECTRTDGVGYCERYGHSALEV